MTAVHGYGACLGRNRPGNELLVDSSDPPDPFIDVRRNPRAHSAVARVVVVRRLRKVCRAPVISTPLVAIVLLQLWGSFQKRVGVVEVCRFYFFDSGQTKVALLVGTVMEVLVAVGRYSDLGHRSHVKGLVAGRSVLVVSYLAFFVA